jgi:hypothetical protein
MLVRLGEPVGGLHIFGRLLWRSCYLDGLAPVSAAGILLLVDPVSEGVEVVVASSQSVEAYCCLCVLVLVSLCYADSRFCCDTFFLAHWGSPFSTGICEKAQFPIRTWKLLPVKIVRPILGCGP